MKAKKGSSAAQSNSQRSSSLSGSSPPVTPSLSTLSSGSAIKKQQSEATRVLFLFSDPLYKDALRLDHKSEIDAVRQAIEQSNKQVHFKVDYASKETLIENLKTYRPHIIHIGGHGDEKGLQFENGYLAPEIISQSDLSLILQSLQPKDLQIAFISACGSEDAGNCFVNAGVPHVVCIKRDDKVSDLSAKYFSGAFYMHLFGGASVFGSFDKALKTASNNPELNETSRNRQHNKFLLLPLPKEDHKLSPFKDSPKGKLKDVDYVDFECDAPPRRFLGREEDLQLAFENIRKNRLLILEGIKGVGKTGLVLTLCEIIKDRNLFDKIVYVPFDRALSSINELSGFHPDLKSEELFSLMIKNYYAINTDKEAFIEQAQNKKVLLVLDGYEKWLRYDPVSWNNTSSTTSTFHSSISSPQLNSSASTPSIVPLALRHQRTDSVSRLSLTPSQEHEKTLLSFVSYFLSKVNEGRVILSGRERLNCQIPHERQTTDLLSKEHSAELFASVLDGVSPDRIFSREDAYIKEKNYDLTAEEFTLKIAIQAHPVFEIIMGNPKAILKIAEDVLRGPRRLGEYQQDATEISRQFGMPIDNRALANTNHQTNSRGESDNFSATPSSRNLAIGNPPFNISQRTSMLQHSHSSSSSMYLSPQEALHNSFREFWRYIKKLIQEEDLTWSILESLLERPYKEVVYPGATSDHVTMGFSNQRVENSLLYDQRELSKDDKSEMQTKFKNQSKITESDLCEFWNDWFHPSLCMLHKLEKYWTRRVIYGFCSSTKANEILKSCSPGTFMLRVGSTEGKKLALSLVVSPGTVCHGWIELVDKGNADISGNGVGKNSNQFGELASSGEVPVRLLVGGVPVQYHSLHHAIQDIASLVTLYPSTKKEYI